MAVDENRVRVRADLRAKTPVRRREPVVLEIRGREQKRRPAADQRCAAAKVARSERADGSHQDSAEACVDRRMVATSRFARDVQGALTANPNRTLFGLNRGGQRVECLFQAPGNFGCRPAA